MLEKFRLKSRLLSLRWVLNCKENQEVMKVMRARNEGMMCLEMTGRPAEYLVNRTSTRF